MIDLKEKVKQRTGIELEHQILLYGGKQLSDEKLLQEYKGFGAKCTIFLVLRGVGGTTTEKSERKLFETEKECKFCLTGPSIIMPCSPVKHTSICSTCLTNFAWNAVESKKTAIKCPDCATEWGLDVIKKYGEASDEDLQSLAEGLSLNVIDTDAKIQNCPNCNCYIQRKDENIPRVRCEICRAEGNPNNYFCWFCRDPWTASSYRYCANPKCDASGGYWV